VNKARAWVAAARPATLGASIAPVVAGSAIARADGAFRLDVAVLAILGAAAIQIGTNLTNDYCDFRKGADDDSRLGPPRATQRGWLSPKAVALGASISFGIAVLFGLQLVAIGGWPIALLGLAGIASGLWYTAGRNALAYVGLAEPFVIAFFGVGAVAGTYFLHTGRLGAAPILAGFALGAIATAILAVNNLRDRTTDARVQKRTLAVRFGERFARLEHNLLIAFAYAIALFAAPLFGWGWLLTFVSAPLAISVIARVRTEDGVRLNPLLGSTAKLEMLFALLLSVGVSA
jgi:1,4-dihydroxy-2-naphthoate polyprenyltransferase